MQVKIKELGGLFSPDGPWQMDKCEESVNQVSLEFTLGTCTFDSTLLDDEPDFQLNERDEISIGYFEDDDLIAEYYPAQDKNWENFVADLREDASADNARVIVNIAKGFVENRVSVFFHNEFFNYISSKRFEIILSIFDDLLDLHPHVTFEFQEGEYQKWHTNRFAFVNRGEIIEWGDATKDTIASSKVICTNNLQTKHLLPEDFKRTENTPREDQFPKLFSNCAQLFVLCFIADYTKIEGNKVEYKINGYRTACKNAEFANVIDIGIPTSTIDIYFQIYFWLYNGGNIFDKIAIVRNIITLNVDEATLLLKETTFDSIQTNYNIYEKKNVEQYIGIRNSVSEQLRNYQKEIINIVDGFENDFKKLLFSFLTFVFTSVLIRCLAKNIESKILLPDSIIYCLIVFCVISFGYFFYSNWEVNEKIRLFDKRYNDTRSFYGEILSEKELQELFMDSKSDKGLYQSFMEEREIKYRCVWIIGVVIVMILLLFMLWLNHQ